MFQLNSEAKNVTVILGVFNSWSVYIWGGGVYSKPGSTPAHSCNPGSSSETGP